MVDHLSVGGVADGSAALAVALPALCCRTLRRCASAAFAE
jgi:hypothetical protein